ncbi:MULTISPECIES: MacB family efflux pump subunit [Pseudomonas]|jgi:macrolide transport system ATP-binding/permease protein|uniref:Macrolide transport system ATP-binding/permease protein n=2 Tax=Pseudomonas fluorescens TaxID=294 RepID=A0ABY1TGS3_PSEFL|nr:MULTISPECIES: MacB family efflux pump subunit [Pseudomonas]MEA3171182.1 macrolide transport system ATP-binding/permease protein [Pseudomonas sp.]MBC8783284.1 MacB family efflux pump subunit [Pseudomonas fluorescens]MCI4606203.1 MacB family efflux pump subunit [Pseudomonas fluorescens]NNB71076.1 MacB family efflux pump subunit [Pseudomonas fluorescens]OEC72744.1 macrolide ABC transporter permease/ATP-binding protein MacB [Pseudomonas sp. AP19]
MTQPLLELKGITRTFMAGEREFIALKGIDLSIHAGEMLAIIGASGSGKSTLMNILGGLDYATAGSYKIKGIETRSLGDEQLAELRRDYFGFIFQRYHLLAHLSALHNVEMPAIYAGTPQTQRHSRARELLTRLGLAGHTSHRPSQLSGGQQQRVSIARALMNGGEVILADEPTGALDTHSGKEVMRILAELHAAGHTVIIVTHDPKVAANAQRIVEVCDGEIVSDQANDRVGLALPSEAPIESTRSGARRLVASLGLFKEAFNMAWVALISHRMRTLLTMLGIVIGITSVVSISAIGEGAKRYVLKDIQAIGSNTIDIFSGTSFGDSRASAIETLMPSDVEALNQLYYVDSATPVVGRNLLLRFGNIDVDAQVNGVSDRYFNVKGLKLEAGIAFSESDARRQAQVVVIDHNTRHRLFGPNVDPLGQVILVGNLPCTVIGVTADNKNMFAASKALNVWVPYETAAGRLLGQRHLDSITVRIKDGQPSKVVEDNVNKLMLQRHGTKDFFTNNLDSIMQTVQKTSRSLALLLSLIAVISLLVGGIGVMNIMLVSVTERTREIGIRMAVGARQSDIRQQFLVEAVMVCLIGGMIGISLSFAIGYLFSLFVKEWEMVFSLGSIVTAFACSTMIGIVFGFVPARNAARLDPIEALARD